MATRKDYIERLAGRLHEIDARIDELRLGAEKSGSEAREKIRARMAELREKRDSAANLLDELHETGDDAWKGIKARVDKLYDDVKDIFKRAA